MINYKSEIGKLEKIICNKKYEIKCLKDEVSIITSKISEYSRLYDENNKSSIEANKILAGYSRQTLSEIVLVFMNLFTKYGEGRKKSILNKIDYSKAIKDEEFFNQVIIAIGRPTIENIFKDVDGVEINEDGESGIKLKYLGVNSKNLGNRIFSKLTKKSLEDYIIRQGYLK